MNRIITVYILAEVIYIFHIDPATAKFGLHILAKHTLTRRDAKYFINPR